MHTAQLGANDLHRAEIPDFCDARQGGGAYGKTPAVLASSGALLFAHMFFPALSPDSVDNRITAFE